MPGNDRTGPCGEGPMTGRGLGQCGRGLARGFNGRGYRRRRAPEPQAPTNEEEKRILEAELKELETEKQALEKRKQELDNA
ncbi:MAG: DUF5320 domain-containing protein [Nanoarchaeota archaeon]|nr:DUF5320 domain-containing protein [Nanoarchaeota archaeon]